MFVILDRDGVINYDSPNFIKSAAEWIPISGSLEAITNLNHAGFKVIVATNQSGLGRGLYNEITLQHIHEKMQASLAALGGHIDAIYYCPHHPDDQCQCRKPKPGLLLQIAHDFALDLSKDAVCIGDSLRDIQAAQTVTCRAILVQTGNGAVVSQQRHLLENVEIFVDLAAVAAVLIAEK